MPIDDSKDFLRKLEEDPEFRKKVQKEYEKLTKKERDKKANRNGDM